MAPLAGGNGPEPVDIVPIRMTEPWRSAAIAICKFFDDLEQWQ